MQAVRVDKWLWAARFFKTRTLATDAVASGKVKVGEDRIKPSRDVKIGDRLLVDNGATRWEIDVTGLADKRGSAVVAQGLYRETAESIAAREEATQNRKLYQEPALAIRQGRPTKRDRRMLDMTTGSE